MIHSTLRFDAGHGVQDAQAAALAAIDGQSHVQAGAVAGGLAIRILPPRRLARIEPLLAESIAEDLGAAPDDIRPNMIAASVTAALSAVRERVAKESTESIPLERALSAVDDALEFLRGGLEALQRVP